jgi:catechol 2,3-dioxygenase-like lactoylglutathione lyase family enzyme
MRITGILETCLCAPDLDAVRRFYSDVLGLEVYSQQPGRHVFFRCGQAMFLVFNSDSTRIDRVVVGGVALPNHGTTGAGHVAFRVSDSELESWRDRLAAAGVAVEAQVDWPNGGRSLYFRDPGGNSLELATPRLWELSEEQP